MPASSPLWILGAPDAEMTAIESLLRECGQDYAYAACMARRYDAALGRMVPVLDAAGEPVRQRVPPGTRADVGLLIWPEDRLEQVPAPGREVIAIEVAGPWGPPAIDHHDGAERASWGPDRFLAASSIGQVIERLAVIGTLPDSWDSLPTGSIVGLDAPGTLMSAMNLDGRPAGVVARDFSVWLIPQALVMEAVADHCPAAAIKGRCPGVDPGAFAPFLAESKRRQYFPSMSFEDFARELEVSRTTLRMAPPCTALDTLVPTEIQGPDGDWFDAGMQPAGYIRDLRHLEPGNVPAQGSGECYPSAFLVGIVAAIFEGIGFVCRIRREDGKLALRSNGHGQGTLAGTRPAEVFLADPAAFGCGPTQPAGRDASYGNPVRGFFGGTLIDQEL